MPEEPELFGAERLPEGLETLPRGAEPLEPEGRETVPVFDDGLELLRTDDRLFPEGFCELVVVVVFLRTVELAASRRTRR